MKYIITANEDKRITDISISIGYETNGNIILDNGTQIACFREVEVHEVEEIPEGIKAEKYCYTEEEGFYKNPNYKEIITQEVEIEQLKEQITDLQLALAEIVEGGI